MLASTALPSTAHAQGAPVQLTMSNVTRMFTAMQHLAIASAAHPELADALSIDADASDAQAVAKISANPAAVAALRSAGLTPRDYVAVSLTFLGAQMAYGVSKGVKAYKVPASIGSANVAFVRDHAAELAALEKRMEAEIRKAMPQGADADTSSN